MELHALVVSLLEVAFVVLVLLTFAGMLTWVERKQGGMMANRLGANRAYIPVPVFRDGRIQWSDRFSIMGLFHLLADGGKMILKEDFRPPFVDKFIYNLAPWFALVPVFVVFAVVPFGGPVQPGHLLDGWTFGVLDGVAAWLFSVFGDEVYELQVAELDVGILFLFAASSLGVFGGVLAGWSSKNKFSMLGALRGAAQMVSYEVFVGLSIIPLLLIHGTLRLDVVAANQAHSIWMWGLIAQLPMLFVFMTGAMAENKRVPFDMPEAESELVAGFMTEYSAMKMGMFMFSEFVEIAVIAALVTTLFLGAYSLPGLDFTTDESGVVVGSLFGLQISHLTLVVLHLLIYWGKVALLCSLQILVRWTLPKFRYDQIMNIGWKILLPLSLVNLVVTAGLVALDLPVPLIGLGSLVAFLAATYLGTRGTGYAREQSAREQVAREQEVAA